MAIRVTGIADVLESLTKGIQGYGQKTAKATMQAGLKTEYFVKQNTPVKTGNLKSNIKTQMISQQKDKVEAFVGTNVSYAPFVEFGTKRMEPRAMFRKAIDEHGKEIWQTYNNYLKNHES
jgi:HK97 gp10 family phage protein